MYSQSTLINIDLNNSRILITSLRSFLYHRKWECVKVVLITGMSVILSNNLYVYRRWIRGFKFLSHALTTKTETSVMALKFSLQQFKVILLTQWTRKDVSKKQI